ncbi:hypothetical protein M407DRAFT_24270 [Tulasnella calospora MUT 4182]|uniref:F-box domain-containing protein n=1 Tax=Tulasnella calospora MUT 4182 TaxID=1051891 RepID=A0A0C3QI54_9AGAM|nr:hypothetical protein M407DRAFT_24270 [Tulasnella calospora MUT 4182]
MSTVTTPTLTRCTSAPPPASFPAEIVLDCLEALVEQVCESNDFSQAYETLSSCAQVSRLWNAPAQRVLLSNVELVRRDHAMSLFNTLQRQGRGSSVRNLVVGVGKAELGQHMLDASTLSQLLYMCPNVRKLTLLHHDLPYISPCLIPEMPHLTDVTIAASGWKSSPRIEVDFLQALPRIRFLQLPCPEFARAFPKDIETLPAPFQLFGLSAQQYPTPISQWALQNSTNTLQCLTVAFLGDLPLLATKHPRLRSLRILTRLSSSSVSAAATSALNLGALPYLERLEIRDLSVKPPFLRTLPPSIQYLRIWSTDLARELAELLEERERTPESDFARNLKTVVWDWYCPKGGSQDARLALEMRNMLNRLRQVCEEAGIELRLYERTDGRRASQGKDMEYEVELRASCYRAFNLRPVPLFDSAAELTTKLPTRVVRDMHGLGIPLAAHFKSVSPFMDSTPGLWSPIFEDCFEGHGDWLERHLPALQKKNNRRSI